MKRAVIVVIGTASVVLLGISGFAFKRALEGDPLPPLLRGVTARGGWWGACPPRNASEARFQNGSTLALSPELNRKLIQEFPTGTSEKALVESLLGQDFNIVEPCTSDRSVRQAVYRQKTGLTPANAAIYWKVDSSDSIVWVKGFVDYDGL